MGLRERILNFFAPPKAGPSPQDDREPTLEQLNSPSIAWSGEAGLGYGPLGGVKYNPDDLIGRKGFSIYKRMMIDEQCKSVMYFKRSTITGREWMFRLDGDKHGLSDKETQRRIDLFTAMIDAYQGSFTDGLNAIMKCIWQGYSMTEQMFELFPFDGKNYWGIAELKSKPFDTFYPKLDPMGQVDYWFQRGGPGSNAEVRLDLTKFVYHRFNMDVDEQYGGSDLRAAYRAFLSKDIAIRFLNIFMERLAAGFVVMKPAEGRVIRRDSQEWKDLTAMLQGITGKTSMLLPSGIDVEIVQASGGQVSTFREAIELADMSISKAALVPNLLGLSGQQKHGSYGQADTQFDVFMIIADDEAGRLAEVLNEQVFAPLARVNFPDGIAPEFAFKPLDDRKVARLLTDWSALVTAKAVQPSESDEAHIRDMLELPEKTALLEPPVPISAPAVAPAATPPPGGKAESGADPAAPPGRGDKSDAQRDKPDRGRSKMSDRDVALFALAQRRVAFAVIARQADAELERHRHSIENAFAAMVRDGVQNIRAQLTETNVGRFQFDRMKAQNLNTQVRRMLKSGMDIGADHGKREIDRARGARFVHLRLDMARMNEMAAEWMKQKAFTISGDIEAGAVKEIKNVLVGALKNTWADEEIRQRIYTALVSKGFLSSQSAADALTDGDLAQVAKELEIETDVTPARLETVIRTNMFEAINEARYDAFTDPALADFVTGMQYSAILDSRTTEICQSLDGHAWTSARWENDLRPWVPPNHFNCRSLLVPVTRTDEQDFDQELPEEQPAEGFG